MNTFKLSMTKLRNLYCLLQNWASSDKPVLLLRCVNQLFNIFCRVGNISNMSLNLTINDCCSTFCYIMFVQPAVKQSKKINNTCVTFSQHRTKKIMWTTFFALFLNYIKNYLAHRFYMFFFCREEFEQNRFNHQTSLNKIFYFINYCIFFHFFMFYLIIIIIIIWNK